MYIHELSPAPYSKKSTKRVGRGIGSGVGKTSGRGQKGQNSRSGGGVRPGFGGGQIPLIRRLPKRGFNNHFRKEYTTVNVSELERFDNDTVIDAKFLMENGVIGKVAEYGLKILGNGDLTKKLTIYAAKWTQSALDKVTKVGGTIEVK